MATPDFFQTRLPRILETLIERTEANEITWERAAFPDSYGVTVGEVRFRVRSTNGNGEPPYILEFLGEPSLQPSVTGQPSPVPGSDELVTRLYRAARTSAPAPPDPFESVERSLGLGDEASG